LKIFGAFHEVSGVGDVEDALQLRSRQGLDRARVSIKTGFLPSEVEQEEIFLSRHPKCACHRAGRRAVRDNGLQGRHENRTHGVKRVDGYATRVLPIPAVRRTSKPSNCGCPR
jgi:hypothetical protein